MISFGDPSLEFYYGATLGPAVFIYYRRLFPPENEEMSTPPPCGSLIGIYIFYENWSTETFGNFWKGIVKRAGCYLLLFTQG
jgi:hypothetical protein